MSNINWHEIHAAMERVDRARRDVGLGLFGCADVFGGTYYGDRYERAGLAGLCDLRSAVETLATQTWREVHDASRQLRIALRRVEPRRGDWWVVDGATVYGEYQSHRGAATVAGRLRRRLQAVGSFRPVTVVHGETLRRQVREQTIERARKLAALAITIAHARRALWEAGVAPDPAGLICGTGRGYGLAGLRWLAGDEREVGPPTRDQVRAFALGAPIESLAAH